MRRDHLGHHRPVDACLACHCDGAFEAAGIATLIHAGVESGQRATILSVQSLALQAAGALGVNVLSRVSELTAPAVAFIVVAALISTSTLALRAIGQMPIR